MSQRTLASLLLVFGCAAACGKTGSEPETAGLDASTEPSEPLDFAPFDETVSSFIAEQGLAGAGAIILERERGAVHEAAYGSFAEDRVYLLASASKILSAGVILRLADEGVVELDAPIGQYVESWGEDKAELTLAQLLSNSAGMLGLGENSTYQAYLCQFLPTDTLRGCARKIFSASDAETRSEPDTMFRYGGAQWQLAGGVAEAASNLSWRELVADTYTKRCGTSDLGYTNQFAQAFFDGEEGGFAYPSFFEAELDNLPDTENPNIEGGAYATVADYGKVLLMHLRGGTCGDERVLSEQAVLRMQTDRIGEVYQGTAGSGDLAGYGLGWFVDRDHPGVVVDPGAYGAMAWLDNERGYAAFIALEAESALGHMLRERVLPILEATFASGAR